MKKSSSATAFLVEETFLPSVAGRLVVWEVVRDPLVDARERRHLVRGVDDGQPDEGGVTEDGDYSHKGPSINDVTLERGGGALPKRDKQY